jgi:hypothetical protein
MKDYADWTGDCRAAMTGEGTGEHCCMLHHMYAILGGRYWGSAFHIGMSAVYAACLCS